MSEKKLNAFSRELAQSVSNFVLNRENHAWYYFSQSLNLTDQQIADAYGVCREAIRKRVTQYAHKNGLTLDKSINRKENKNAKN